jgi:hypothetical protein
MSEQEQKKPREMSVINQEYSTLCAKAGDLQYRLVAMKSDLDQINETIKNLAFEGAASQRLAAEEAEKVKQESLKVTEAEAS